VIVLAVLQKQFGSVSTRFSVSEQAMRQRPSSPRRIPVKAAPTTRASRQIDPGKGQRMNRELFFEFRYNAGVSSPGVDHCLLALESVCDGGDSSSN
jgi:hypothetical protein